MLYRTVELSTLRGKSRGGKNAIKAFEQYFKRSAICKLLVSFLHFQWKILNSFKIKLLPISKRSDTANYFQLSSEVTRTIESTRKIYLIHAPTSVSCKCPPQEKDDCSSLPLLTVQQVDGKDCLCLYSTICWRTIDNQSYSQEYCEAQLEFFAKYHLFR